MKAYKIKWLDSSGTDTVWTTDIIKPVACVSVGFLLKRTKKYITLCSSYTHGGLYGEVFTIPYGCITSIRRIK